MATSILYAPRLTQRPDAFVLNRASPLYPGLVFAGLGASAGTNFYRDSSDYGNHGTLTNMDPATDWVWDGTLGRWCLDFDGSNDYVDVARSPADGASRATMFGWFYRPNTATAIYAAHGCTAAANALWGLNRYNDGNIYVAVNSAWGSVANNGVGWQHLAVIHDGTQSIGWGTSERIYTDGVERGWARSTGTPSASLSSGYSLHLGRDLSAALGSRYGGGWISDLIIVSAVLPPDYICALADPSNVDLRVGDVPLILPTRTFWPAVVSGDTTSTNIELPVIQVAV